jgi:hypothetical protein
LDTLMEEAKEYDPISAWEETIGGVRWKTKTNDISIIYLLLYYSDGLICS